MVSFTWKIISFASLVLLPVMTFNGSMCSGSSKIRCHERDRRILLIFRQGIIDPQNNLYSWSTEQDCCAWEGVQCDNMTGRVKGLDLQNKLLQGEINFSLLELEFLDYLNLSYNAFEAVSSPSIHGQRYHNQSLATSPLIYANFSSYLLYLDFSYNRRLHMDNLHWLSLVPSLKYLDLSGIDLHNETNWLQFVTMLPSLSELSLDQCRLTSISPSLKYVNFTSLASLVLSGNYFDSELPDWLFNLSSGISYVDLRFSHLQGQLPKSLGNVRNLKSLHLSGNKFNGTIPDWLGQLENIQELDISYNSFHGSIPSTLGNLSSLAHLDISFNNLSGDLPESLGKLSKLESLIVGGNSLEDVLSETNFKGLLNLKKLDLGGSSFSFDLGPNWIPPFQLHYLNLRSSNLGPKIPSWIYTQRSIEELLDISNTGISSTINDMFWNLVGRIKGTLNISNNFISGDLSNVLLNTQNIFLASNNFKGGLPRISENVSSLGLSHNSFSGSISPLLCNIVTKEFSKLAYMDLSDNLLTGELPDCWKNISQMFAFNLGNNRLTGELPPSLGSLSFLEAMYLHNNSLIGEIPLSLRDCKYLKVVNLERNKFSGSIPAWMPQEITFLNLRSNHFAGNIPSQLCQLSSLIVLDIADNKLSGSIPQCLYNLTAMVEDDGPAFSEIIYYNDARIQYSIMLNTRGHESEYTSNLYLQRSFDLSWNNLSGEIPPEIFKLVELQSLSLSQNHLTGRIPKNIGDMKKLEFLDLSNNRLSGEIPQSMAELNFLSHLNLSYNDFTGQIPSGRQLVTFDSWSYIGNPQLCGDPLTKNCIKEETPVAAEHDESGAKSWFYLGMGVGFGVGFWGVCGAIFFNRAFRLGYFRLLDRVGDKIYVAVALKFNKFH